MENPNELSLQELAALDLPILFSKLESGAQGLTSQQAATQLQRFGPNTLQMPGGPSSGRRLLQLVGAPLSLLLMALATVSFLTGEVRGAVVIATMVILSTLLTFVQERKSNRAAEKLRNLVKTFALVERDGQAQKIALDAVVPGDVLHLAVGDLIAADVRIIEAKDLFINEASLSGESLPTEKHPNPAGHGKPIGLTDQNLCFMGSHVVSGIGSALVVRTGAATFFAEVARQTTAQTRKSAFDQGLERFTGLMIRFMAVMVPIVFIVNGLAKGDWFEAALFALAVAVGLTPEMLPMLTTVNLAKGALALSRQKVIVKRLNAVQNMGAMDILCTDKTGTLTQDTVIVERHINVAGEPDNLVLEYAYLNSRYQSGLSNLLDVAVLKHHDIHEKLHEVDTWQKVDEIPFDFERRRMSVVLEKNQQSRVLICKGAVEEVVGCCTTAKVGNDFVPLDASHRSLMDAVVAKLNQEGFRVIAVAIREEPAATKTGNTKTFSIADEQELALLGYVAFLDPPKDSARPALEALRACAIEVKILTGDNPLITRKVCQDVGLSVDRILLGEEVDALSDAALALVAESTVVFAKMAPQQKSRVIRALQSRGHVVGYMGDGINDGPSLKTADLSISVESAVDIAKESADIILLEKSLLVLQQGVLEGRRVFSNIMKTIRMSASSNFGNMFSMIGASALLPFLPMAPVQILLNNLLYDCSQTAVPTDSVDAEYLARPRAWDIGAIARTMFRLGPISSLFDYATFALLWFALGADSPGSASLFQTGWFVESLLSQTLIVHVLRTHRLPFVESSPSATLLATTLGVCVIGIGLPYTTFGGSFHLVPLPVSFWFGMAVLLPAYFILTQWAKTRMVRRFGLS